MKNNLLFLITIVAFIASCSNAPDRNMDMMETAPEPAYETIPADFDKVAYYEDLIREKYMEHIEESKLKQNFPGLIDSTLNSVHPKFEKRFSYRRMELKYIPDGINWQPDFGYVLNPEHEYHYSMSKIYYDSVLQKEQRFGGLVTIDENVQIINGDTIKTVQVIWEHPYSH